MLDVLNYSSQDKLTFEDRKAKKTFLEHQSEFPLDAGGLNEREKAAKDFQEKYFKDTPYIVYVEEYCCNCTVTTLMRKTP